MPADDDNNRIRVAIVGTGLAGLATGYLLHNDERNRYDVTLFERVRIPLRCAN
jgi:predicted NAD/FAD-binding protein